MRKITVFVAICSAAMSVFAAMVLSEITAQDQLAGIVRVNNAKMTQTAEALSFTDIRWDMQIECRMKPFYAADVDRFEFFYRATGDAGTVGGEVFYTIGVKDGFTGERLWRIPPLTRDGKWHVMTIDRQTMEHSPDWKNAGVIERIRFDPTNQEGGTLEIKWFRFVREWRDGDVPVVPNTEVSPEVAKTLDQDVWPSVLVRVWGKNEPATADGLSRLIVKRLGGTAEPRSARAGENIRLRYDFKGRMPKPTDSMELTVSLFDGTSLHWDERVVVECCSSVHALGGDIWRLEFDYELPLYVASGEMNVRIESPSLCNADDVYRDARLTLRRIACDPLWAKPLRSGVEKVADSTYFTVNGQPLASLWGAVMWTHRKDQMPRHSSAPLNMVTLWCTDVRKWWPKGEEFVPAEIDRVAEKSRRVNPNAYFMAEIQVYPPNDWAEANPDELSRDSNGVVPTDGRHANFSFASEKAITVMERMAVKAIRHIEASPYANRVIGYRINSGRTIEWLDWRTKKREDVLDFSPASRRGFEAFAHENYPEITDFSIPTFEERCAADSSELLLDRRRYARVLAYHEFVSASVADDIIRLCGTAKKVLDGRKVVGTYYGYVMTIKEPSSGHFALQRLLDSKTVDFLMSPPWYATCARGPGMTLVDMKPFRTIQNHNMISVIEDDTRTHNMRLDSRISLTQALNEEMSVNYLRRNMGIALCRNQPFYTLALTSGAEFDFPQFADDAAQYHLFAKHALSTKTRRAAEVAVVVSETAQLAIPVMKGKSERYRRGDQWYLPDGSTHCESRTGAAPFRGWQFQQAYTDYARMGCGVDYLLAEDLEANPGDYKLYIMQSCNVSMPSLRMAAEKLRGRDCALLWTYAPGYVSGTGNSVENMRELTGLDFVKCGDLSDPGIVLNDGERIGPLRSDAGLYFALKSAEAVYGRYSNGAIAFGSCRTGRATSFFSGTYVLESPVLRKVAKAAGVHLFSDTLDPVEANERFVSFHVRTAGRKTIRLPRKTTVIDVFNREVVAKGVDEFSFDAALHSSWLFYFADDAEELLRGL